MTMKGLCSDEIINVTFSTICKMLCGGKQTAHDRKQTISTVKQGLWLLPAVLKLFLLVRVDGEVY